MTGMVEFPTLLAALRAGFHVFDRTETGYLVRSKTAAGYALAIVTLKPKSTEN